MPVTPTPASAPTRFARPATVTAVALLSVLGALTGCQSADRAGGVAASPGDVGGRMLLTLGDADPPADAAATMLADRRPGVRDALTIVSLPIREPVTPSGQVEVSSSALGPPGCLALSPDGRFAFVTESRGPGVEGFGRSAASLPAGENLSIVDLAAPTTPQVVSTVYVGARPQAVAVHPSGNLVAVVTDNPGNQIVMLPVDADGQPGEPVAWALTAIDPTGALPSSVAWHPSGRALAITLADRNQVVFYAFTRDAGGDGPASFGLAAWGEPVTVGERPIFGLFAANGRVFISIDAGAGASGGLGAVPTGTGRLSVIRVADSPLAPPAPGASHRLLGGAEIGIGPVGLALSPDGRLLAAANTAASTGAAGGSVSLLGLATDGTLTPRGEFSIGAVPAGLAFDPRGRFLLVSQYRSLDPEAADGEVSFWRVRSGTAGPALEQQDFFIGIGAGPHGSLIVR